MRKARGYLNLIVEYKNRKRVFLKDIAEHINKLENDNFIAWFWGRGYGEPIVGVIFVAVKNAVDMNEIELSRKINDLLPVLGIHCK